MPTAKTEMAIPEGFTEAEWAERVAEYEREADAAENAAATPTAEVKADVPAVAEVEPPRAPESTSEAARWVATVEAQMPKIAEVLPPGVSVDKFKRVLLSAMLQEPKLKDADSQRLWTAVVACAQDGLLPDKREAVLLPNHDKHARGGKGVLYIPMVFGIRKRILQSGDVAFLNAQIVRSEDRFEVHLGDTPRVLHEPASFGARGDMVGVYAVARTKDGELYVETLARDEVDAVRARSPAYRNKYGPWLTDYDEMARKTALRRLSKSLPMSESDRRLIERVDALYDLEGEAVPAPAPARAIPSAIGQMARLAARKEARP